MSEVFGVRRVLSYGSRRSVEHDSGLDWKDQTATDALSIQIMEKFRGQALIVDLLDWANKFFDTAAPQSFRAVGLTESDVTMIQQLLQASHLPSTPLVFKNGEEIVLSNFSELVTFLATLHDRLLTQGKKRLVYSKEPILDAVEAVLRGES